MRRTSLIICLMTLAAAGAWAQTTYTVDIGGGGTHTTIEDAVAVAVDGDVINVSADTYTPPSTIYISEDISIIGAGSGVGGTIVQFNFGGGSGYGMSISSDNIVLTGMTLQGAGAAGPRYGLHISGAAFADAPSGSLTDIEATAFYRTALDLNGVDGFAISQCNSHDNGGAGMALCDGKNVTFTDITTSNNAWGGVAIYSYGQYHTPGVWGISFAGTNTHPDAFYIEEGSFSDPANPIAISFSANAGDGADVTLQLGDFGYFMTESSGHLSEYL